jgi:NADPH:quinone reductase-like Zn-dependent oxidoreductase
VIATASTEEKRELTRSLGADAAADPTRVLELTERSRKALQELLDADVAARRSVYL